MPGYFYLGSPMSGYEDHNVPAILAAREALQNKGYKIVAPYEVHYDLKGFPQHGTSEGRWALQSDLQYIMNSRCEGVVLLAGWEESVGATLEARVGEAFYRPLYHYTEASDGDPVLVSFDGVDDALQAYQRARVWREIRTMGDLTVPHGTMRLWADA